MKFLREASIADGRRKWFDEKEDLSCRERVTPLPEEGGSGLRCYWRIDGALSVESN